MNNYSVNSFFSRENNLKGGVLIMSQPNNQLTVEEVKIKVIEHLKEEKVFEFCSVIVKFKNLKFILVGM